MHQQCRKTFVKIKEDAETSTELFMKMTYLHIWLNLKPFFNVSFGIRQVLGLLPLSGCKHGVRPLTTHVLNNNRIKLIRVK